MKRIVRIEPHYEPRMWGGGTRLRDEFHYVTDDCGRFLHERFAFYTCVKGEGTLNGIPVRQGDTLLVPAGTGWIELNGKLDLFLASYRNAGFTAG